MMSNFRALWFSLFVPLFACGGDEPVANRSTPVVDRAVAVVPDAAVVDGVDVTPREAPVPVAVPVVDTMPATYAERMTLGKALVAKGEHPRARELFTAAAQLEKRHAEPHIELARSYIATHDRALAIKSANKAVKLAPKSSAAYNTLGRAELLRHGYDNAIAAFTEATELDAGNAWAWNNLGYTHLLLKQYELAVLALVEATAKPSATGYMWNNLGLAYEQLDELDNARFAFEKGGKLGSKEAVASRKRLEGVDSIVVVSKPSSLDVADEAQSETSYPGREPTPDVDEAEAVADDATAEAEEEAEQEAELRVDVKVKVEEVNGQPVDEEVAPVPEPQ